MDNKKQQNIIGLGTVTFRAVERQDLYPIVQNLPQSSQPFSSFANAILASMIEEPSFIPSDIESLPDSTKQKLITSVAGILEITEEFNNTPLNLSFSERLYQAYLQVRLAEKITNQLNSLVGHKLNEVNYWCLANETTLEDLYHPKFYLGGEVELIFADTKPVMITWDENAGWESHFSVQLRGSSASSSGSLEKWKASNLPIWERLLGTELKTAKVLGLDRSPHIIEFEFSKGSIFIGSAYQTSFGDGDDVLIAAELSEVNLSTLEILWESTD